MAKSGLTILEMEDIEFEFHQHHLVESVTPSFSSVVAYSVCFLGSPKVTPLGGAYTPGFPSVFASLGETCHT